LSSSAAWRAGSGVVLLRGLLLVLGFVGGGEGKRGKLLLGE